MYRAFLSPELAAQLADTAQAVPEVPGLQVTPALLEDFPDIESPEILGAVVEVFGEVQEEVEGDKEHFFLLFNNLRQLLLILPELSLRLLILLHVLDIFQIFIFLALN